MEGWVVAGFWRRAVWRVGVERRRWRSGFDFSVVPGGSQPGEGGGTGWPVGSLRGVLGGGSWCWEGWCGVWLELWSG